MTDAEYKVLKTAFDYDFIAVEMNSLDVSEQEAAIKLSRAGLITMYGCNDSFIITDSGKTAVLRFEEQKQAIEYHAKKEADQNAKDREKEAAKELREEKKQRTKDRRETFFFWLRAFLDLLFLVAGILLERYVDIGNLISGLFT